MKLVKIFILVVILVALAEGLNVFRLNNFKRSGNMIYGVSFSTEYARYLGFNPKDIFIKMLDEWNFKYIRLSAQWNLIEKVKGKYDFEELDWMMNESAKRNAKVMLAVGHKTPRWPECHAPKWVDFSQEKKHQPDLDNFIKVVVERYKNHPALEIWQVENEPFLQFGDCLPMFPGDLKEEIDLVKSIDQKHPIIITDSGELSWWRRTAKVTDLFGTTMYRVVWNKSFGYLNYDWFMPAFVYRAKLWFNGRDVSTAYITELQAEPWIPSMTLTSTLMSEQSKSMDLNRLKKNILFAERTGMPRAYLWGAEWWYWLEKQSEHKIPDFIKILQKH